MNKKERKEYNNKYHQDHRDSISNSKKDYYKKNSVILKEGIYRRRKKIRDLIIKTKDVPCADCLKKYPYYVMDLDHVKGEKKFNLATAGNRLVSLEKVKEEIGKCEVVCANCHRIRTFKRGSML